MPTTKYAKVVARWRREGGETAMEVKPRRAGEPAELGCCKQPERPSALALQVERKSDLLVVASAPVPLSVPFSRVSLLPSPHCRSFAPSHSQCTHIDALKLSGARAASTTGPLPSTAAARFPTLPSTRSRSLSAYRGSPRCPHRSPPPQPPHPPRHPPTASYTSPRVEPRTSAAL